jgi:hypothetical protein
MVLPPFVCAMADAHGGSVSRRDLIAAGVHPATIDRWLAAGLLVRVGWGEYRVAGSGNAEQQRVASMVWRAGKGAHIGGAMGLGLLGVKGFTADLTDHIAVPRRREITGVDFTVVRTVIPDHHRTRWNDVPMLIAERLFIGAAATHRQARIRVAWDDARWKGLVQLGRLDECLGELGRAYGAPQMRRIRPALEMESEPERDLFGIFRRSDPKPVPQVWVPWNDKWFRLDFAFLDARLDLEYDGDNHDATREKDADRDLALKELTIEPIRVTKAMMRDPAATRRRILEVYRQRMAMGLTPLVPQTPPWLT